MHAKTGGIDEDVRLSEQRGEIATQLIGVAIAGEVLGDQLGDVLCPGKRTVDDVYTACFIVGEAETDGHAGAASPQHSDVLSIDGNAVLYETFAKACAVHIVAHQFAIPVDYDVHCLGQRGKGIYFI